jgi:hypothetical protein
VILLPLLAFIAWALAFHRGGRDWLDASVASLVVFGVTVALGTELQSLVGLLTPAGSLVVWVLAAALGLLVSRRPGGPAERAEDESGGPRWLDAAPAILLLSLTAAVALISAPNSPDALSYHLTRVEAWIQQGSVRPYAAHDTRQLFMPSWPEYAILQLRLLSGNDRFANMVQWIAFAGAGGGAAVLARALGGGRWAALLAATLVSTLPMAVAQGSGTQTDLVAACWAVTTCAYGYRLLSDPMRWGPLVLSALSLGLAAATKQTAMLFAGLALLPALLLTFRNSPRRAARWVVAIGLAIVVIAGPQLKRNLDVFGSVAGDRALVGSMVMATRPPAQVVVNVMRNLAVHFGTPWDGINHGVVDGVRGVARSIGVDPDDRRTTWGTDFTPVPWNTHEEAAPNPLHLLLILGCLLALIRPGPGAVPRILFVAALVAGFVVFSASLKWQFYSGRLHTPFFALALAWAAVELERAPLTARRLLLLLFMLAALPGALLNYTRPLLSLPAARVTPRPSILEVHRNLHYFMYMPNLGRPYLDVALKIADSGCEDVGVRAYFWEYAVRALIRNAGSDPRFRNVDVQNESKRFTVAGGTPCLLLQTGLNAATLPPWAANWRPLANHSALGVRGVALFAPPQ